MGLFESYLHLGIEHILDLKAYDHILFVVTLCSVYVLSDWKKILILVTAFTAGHSLTLALSALDIVSVNAGIVELLIPCTIIITALYNIYRMKQISKLQQSVLWNYIMALSFGFIHGMGFSYYFKAILGSEESILLPLFSFNLGVEVGQLFIVILYFSGLGLIVSLIGINRIIWTSVISTIAILISANLIFNLLQS